MVHHAIETTTAWAEMFVNRLRLSIIDWFHKKKLVPSQWLHGSKIGASKSSRGFASNVTIVEYQRQLFDVSKGLKHDRHSFFAVGCPTICIIYCKLSDPTKILQIQHSMATFQFICESTNTSSFNIPAECAPIDRKRLVVKIYSIRLEIEPG